MANVRDRMEALLEELDEGVWSDQPVKKTPSKVGEPAGEYHPKAEIRRRLRAAARLKAKAKKYPELQSTIKGHLLHIKAQRAKLQTARGERKKAQAEKEGDAAAKKTQSVWRRVRARLSR
jgi:hypothetical protein